MAFWYLVKLSKMRLNVNIDVHDNSPDTADSPLASENCTVTPLVLEDTFVIILLSYHLWIIQHVFCGWSLSQYFSIFHSTKCLLQATWNEKSAQCF